MNLSLSLQSRLQYQHQTVSELILGFDEDRLKVRTIPEKWSPFENITHLVSYQMIFQTRIEKILTERNPVFERYVAENDPVFYEYLKETPKSLLQKLCTIREHICKQLNELHPQELSRIGHHPKFGALTLVQWTEFFLLHEAHHLFTLFKLLTEAEAPSE